MAATAAENLQTTLAEVAHGHGAGAWSIGCWLDSGLREVPLLVVIDAKRLWAKIQAEYKNQEEGNDLHSSPHGDIDPCSCEGLLGQFRTFDCRRSDQGLKQESQPELRLAVARFGERHGAHHVLHGELAQGSGHDLSRHAA